MCDCKSSNQTASAPCRSYMRRHGKKRSRAGSQERLVQRGFFTGQSISEIGVDLVLRIFEGASLLIKGCVLQIEIHLRRHGLVGAGNSGGSAISTSAATTAAAKANLLTVKKWRLAMFGGPNIFCKRRCTSCGSCAFFCADTAERSRCSPQL